MPTPVSAIAISTLVRRRGAATRRCARRSGVNFTALVSTFQNTCCRRVVSAHDRAGERVEVHVERDALGVGGGLDALDRFAQHGDDRNRLRIEPDLAGRDARHVEQILDQLILRDGVPLDDVDRARPLLRRDRVGLQHPGVAEDDVERRAQLVRQRGEELVLQLVGGLRRALGFAQRHLGALARR